MAIELTIRSAARSLTSSALKPDLRILWKVSIFASVDGGPSQQRIFYRASSLQAWLDAVRAKSRREAAEPIARRRRVRHFRTAEGAMVRYLGDGRIEIDNSATEPGLAGLPPVAATISSRARIAEANE
jgi:hypothetical protein